MGLGVVDYQMTTLAVVMLFSGMIRAGCFFITRASTVTYSLGGTFLFVATMHILPEVLREQQLSWPQVCLTAILELCVQHCLLTFDLDPGRNFGLWNHLSDIHQL